MINHLHINFYLRKSITDSTKGAIYVRVTVNKKRTTIGAVTTSSGYDIPSSVLIDCVNWNRARQRVKNTDRQAAVINKCIEECEHKLKKLYAQHEGYDLGMTAKGVKIAVRDEGNIRPTLADLAERFLAEKVALRTKKSTVNTYAFKFRPLAEFLKHEAIEEQAAEEFSPGTLKRFRTYLITVRNNRDRSADKTCQAIKTLLIWAAENELITKNPLLYTRIRVDKTPNLECLNQDEVALMREATLTPALRIAADCLEFACYTGLAYQDMQSLTIRSIQTVEGVSCLVGKRIKTGTEYCIPISERVQALMDTYGGVSMPLPKLYNYNPLLHQLMLTLGINKQITSHTGRKTFADWCINELNMSEEATIVAMGQKSANELTPYRKTRPKRLLSEFPGELLPSKAVEVCRAQPFNPFRQIHKAS